MSDNLDEWEFYKNGKLYHKVLMDNCYQDSVHNARFLTIAEALKQSRQQMLKEVIDLIDDQYSIDGVEQSIISKPHLIKTLRERFGDE